MAAFYQNFVSARVTEPDLAALLAALRAQDATAGIQHQFGTQAYTVKKNTPWTDAQINFVQDAIDAAVAWSAQRQAQNEIDRWPISMQAFALALVDQINVLRAKAGLATVTPQQALQAIRDKAGTL